MDFNNRFLQGNFNGGLLGGMPQGQGMQGLLGGMGQGSPLAMMGGFRPMQRPQMGMMGGMGGMFQRNPYQPQRFPTPTAAPPPQQAAPAPAMAPPQGGFSPYHDIPPDLYSNLMFIQSRGGE